MNTHHCDFSICRSVVLIATLAAFGLIAESAWAKKVSFTATVSQVRSACSKAGGTFDVHIDGAGYGCTKKNCNGQGGNCQVQCDNGNNCTGTTPGRTQPGDSALHVLTNSPGLAAAPGNPPPAKSGGLLGDGILGGGMGLGTTGPAATGAPASTGRGSPAAAPVQLR
jgi:hypothetical protein